MERVDRRAELGLKLLKGVDIARLVVGGGGEAEAEAVGREVAERAPHHGRDIQAALRVVQHIAVFPLAIVQAGGQTTAQGHHHLGTGAVGMGTTALVGGDVAYPEYAFCHEGETAIDAVSDAQRTALVGIGVDVYPPYFLGQTVRCGHW